MSKLKPTTILIVNHVLTRQYWHGCFAVSFGQLIQSHDRYWTKYTRTSANSNLSFTLFLESLKTHSFF